MTDSPCGPCCGNGVDSIVLGYDYCKTDCPFYKDWLDKNPVMGRKEKIIPKNEKTSLKVGKLAARGVKYPEKLTLEEIKMVCASVLTQRPDK